MAESEYRHRLINDPIHGSMGFSELEMRVIESRAFRRLRGIKQLGLASNVYPTADYSRLVHSLGVCHLAGRVMERLDQLPISALSEHEWRITRLAALTHDIGHYPFSHAFEASIEKHYQNERAGQGTTNLSRSQDKLTYGHEKVSEQVLTLDPALKEVLSRAKITPKELARRFQRENVVEIGTRVVSSDFDVDRTDYLLRTAHFAGLPYGSVDLDYLIGVLDLDNKDGQWSVVLPLKALRAADHFLLARFFDYQQVAYHKTVTGFEQLLEEAISYLLSQGRIACRRSDVDQMIADGQWIGFDDQYLLGQMKAEREKGGNRPSPNVKRFRLVADAILERRPPRLIGEIEFMAGDEDELSDKFDAKATEASEKIQELAGLSDRLVRWTNHGMRLTKLGADARLDERDGQASDQLVHIRHKSGKIVPLIDEPRSVMHALSAQKWYCARFYALEPEEAELKNWRRESQSILAGIFGSNVVSELTAS